MAVAIWQAAPVTQPDQSIIEVNQSAIPVAVVAVVYLFVFLALASGGKHFRKQRDE